MNKKLLIGLLVAAGIVGGLVVKFSSPLLGGDFAGGQIPGTLETGSAGGGLTGNGYVQPVGSLAYNAQNGLSIGGSDENHGLSAYVTASGTPTTAVTLGAIGLASSTATTTITLPETAGLSIGAICSGSTATTTVYVSGCLLTVTDGVTGTAEVAYTNITSANLPVPTSTLIRISFDQLPY